MNCANHPERPATAFCQSCGKPLCHECTRTFEGLMLCEPDFVAKGGPAGPVAGAVPPQSQGYRPVGWTPPPGPYVAQPAHSSPVLAALLGFIPGVGAMYNGQFIKALLHVVVLIVLIGVSEHFDLAGVLLAAWVFYQVFDAAQTASARRDGRPLPDPFGFLDLSQRLGPQGNTPYAPAPFPPYQTTQATPFNATGDATRGGFSDAKTAPPAYSAPGYGPVAGQTSADPMPDQTPQPGYGASYAQGSAASSQYGAVPSGTPPPPASFSARRSEPVGAIVLIVVGLLFLLSTLGVLDIGWISRGWPVLVLLLGVWLLIRRVSAPAPPPYSPAGYAPPAYGSTPGPASGGATEPGTGIVRANPLSITSQPGFEDRSASQAEAARTEEEEK